MSKKEIKEYDEKGNLIYSKDNSIYKNEFWYDKKGRLIHYKDNTDFQIWYEYDENNGLIHLKTTNNFEEWYKWENNNVINITKQEFKEIEFQKKEKEYLSRTKCSRFELMDI